MDFDYKIFGNILPNANASAKIFYTKNKADIFLHPSKCTDCGAFYDDIEHQTISSLNHEVQEIIVFDIIVGDIGEYKRKWFDETSSKLNRKIFKHKCRRSWFIVNNKLLADSGYVK